MICFMGGSVAHEYHFVLVALIGVAFLFGLKSYVTMYIKFCDTISSKSKCFLCTRTYLLVCAIIIGPKMYCILSFPHVRCAVFGQVCFFGCCVQDLMCHWQLGITKFVLSLGR